MKSINEKLQQDSETRTSLFHESLVVDHVMTFVCHERRTNSVITCIESRLIFILFHYLNCNMVYCTIKHFFHEFYE